MKKKHVFFLGIVILFLSCDNSSSQQSNNLDDSTIVSNMEIKDGMILLPEPKLKGEISVEESLYYRRSVRKYNNEPLSLEEVSQILWAAYGITEEIAGGPYYLRGGLRTAPSAGALYPLDLYLIVGDVIGLDPGIYKYNSEEHSLELLIEGDSRKELCDAALGQTMIEKAPASIVYSAIYSRNTDKYGLRGEERYVCMDLGHSAQNVYLQATALNIGTCAVGAFIDEMVSALMPFSEDEVPLYIMPLGKIDDLFGDD